MDMHVNYSKTYIMMFKLRAMGRCIWLNINPCNIKLHFDTIYVEGLKSMFVLLISVPQLLHCFIIKECKKDLQYVIRSV